MAKQQPKPAPKEAPKPKTKSKPVANGPSFLKFLIGREQWIDWALIAGLSIAILIFLKICYPYPQTETDSGKYIESALTGKINCYRPYGYSGFLSFFHSMSADVRFVVTWQWLVTFISVAFFLFSIKFMFRSLPRIGFYILCIVCLFNPSVIFMDSYIMSDSLFVSLTLLFLTTIMWIIYNGSYVAIAANLLLLWWCMDTRYIGLFYPVLTAAALAWSLWRRFKWVAIVGVVIPIAMLLFYRSAATDKMKEAFGVDTFSGFGGWQKANNGVAVLPFVKVDDKEITDPQIKAIHQLVRQFPDSFFRTEDIMATSFMWTRNYPGKTCLGLYLQNMRQRDPSYDYNKAWLEMGIQMDSYGSFLQSNYRSAFIKSYILPNFKNVFKVHEILDNKDSVSYTDVKDFFTSDRQSYQYHSHFFRSLTAVRVIGDIIVWLLLIISVIAGLMMLRKINWTLEQKLIVAMLVVFIGAFCGASTIAAPINNFRYMMPIFYSQIVVSVLVISGIIMSMRASDKND